MMNVVDERVTIDLCEETLQGLAKSTEIFKSGCLEQDYWGTTPDEKNTDTIMMCQMIISCLRNVCADLKQVGMSLDEKDLNQHRKVRAM